MDQPNYEPHMPQVDEVPEIEEILVKAWSMAQEGDEQGRGPVVLTPSHRIMAFLAIIPAGSMSAEKVKPMEAIIPSKPPRRVLVIALNTIETLMDNEWTKSIPFGGILLGLSYIGHSVLITEGHSSILEFALKDTDYLIVDEGMIPHLQKDWDSVVRRSNVKVLMIFGRDGRIRAWRSEG